MGGTIRTQGAQASVAGVSRACLPLRDPRGFKRGGGCKPAGVHGMQRFPREMLHCRLNTTQLKLNSTQTNRDRARKCCVSLGKRSISVPGPCLFVCLSLSLSLS